MSTDLPLSTSGRRPLPAVALLVGLALALNGCGGSGSRSAAEPAPVSGHAAAVAAAQHHGASQASPDGMNGADEMRGMSGRDDGEAVTGPRTSASSEPSAVPEPETHGFRLNVPLPRPNFVLTDSHGRSYDFAARTRGRATLLYFGYTNCPYQCPTAMADIAVALSRLPRSVRNKISVVFVTTDPERDSPIVLRRWLAYFNAPIIGLTGTRAAVEAAQEAAHVTVSVPKPNEPPPAGPASTAHGGGVLAYGTDDYAHVTYPAGTTSADLVRDLPLLARGHGRH